MPNGPEVCVVVPMFRGETTIAAALESLLSQTLRNLEVIVVDDASKDGGPSAVERIAKRDPRVKLLVLERNAGAHEARAAGIRATGAKWIGFLDADDFARPPMYETLLRRAETEKADIAICGSDLVTEQQTVAGPKARFADGVWNEAFDGYCRGQFGTAALWNKLYRRELVLEHAARPFRWRQNVGEDTIVNAGCFRDARKVVTLREPFHCYTINAQGVSATSGKAKGFAGMVRSYAECMLQYGGDPKTAAGIAVLYSRLLNLECYHVGAAEELAEFRELLAEPLEFLGREHPIALAALMNRGLVPYAAPKSVPVRALRKLKRIVGL